MRVRLGAGLEEADLQRPLADRVVLTQELVHGGVLKQARSDECETPGKRSHGRGWGRCVRPLLRNGQRYARRMDQVVQVIGALLILVAYAAAQFGALNQRSRLYLGLNLLGSAVLTLLAWREEQWGFLLLEAVWAVVSLVGLVRVQRGHVRRLASVARSLKTGSGIPRGDFARRQSAVSARLASTDRAIDARARCDIRARIGT
jgi:hypothetical protein